MAREGSGSARTASSRRGAEIERVLHKMLSFFSRQAEEAARDCAGLKTLSRPGMWHSHCVRDSVLELRKTRNPMPRTLFDLESLTDALKAKRPQVADHSLRVSQYSIGLATQYGLPREALESVRLGALLHDVGKLLVPVTILMKTGRLSRRQEEELKIHPDLGVELAARAGMRDEVCRIILHHHERYDGLGYPDKKSGSEVHWTARIVAVMNAFDALVHPRGNRRPCSVDEARTRIAQQAGSRFCPWIVGGLLSLPSTLLQLAPQRETPVYVPDGRPDPIATLATQAWDFSSYNAGLEANG